MVPNKSDLHQLSSLNSRRLQELNSLLHEQGYHHDAKALSLGGTKCLALELDSPVVHPLTKSALVHGPGYGAKLVARRHFNPDRRLG